MIQPILHRFELYLVNYLYKQSFHRFGRINKIKRKIIFGWFEWSLFQSFHSPKEWLVFSILIRCYGYKAYEEQLCPFRPLKQKISHTWGEIQDIIRDAKKVGIRPRLSELSKESPLNE